MTDEQINAAIAEACGWEDITESVAPEEFRRRATGMLRDKHGNRTPLKQIPNYCADLNAMHEAEEFLSGTLWIGYVNELANIEGNLFGIRATARQRAEAFLRTLGKWPATDKESLTVESSTEQSSAVHIGDTTEMMKEVQK